MTPNDYEAQVARYRTAWDTFAQRKQHYATKAAWLASPGWQTLKRLVLATQDGQCADCAETPWKVGPLELHHEAYPWCGFSGCLPPGTCWGCEDAGAMVGLCRMCHHARHGDINGDFWADPAEKEAYWASFWNELDKP
jgi:hypothetical protein